MDEKVVEKEDTTQQIVPDPKMLDDALFNSIFNRIKEIKDKDGNNFCIIDRTTSSFHEIFRDALYSYRSDCVICERIYKRSSCQETTVPILAATPEAETLYKEFIEYANSIENIDNISEEEAKIIENKLTDYKNKLESDEMKPKVIETKALCYKNEYTNPEGYIVTQLDKVPDQNLEFLLRAVSKFTIAYFLTMKLIFTDQLVINVFPVNTEEYIDIVAMLQVKEQA
jgi:hypothetical protein